MMRASIAALALTLAGPSASTAAPAAWTDEVNVSQTPTDTETGLNHRPVRRRTCVARHHTSRRSAASPHRWGSDSQSESHRTTTNNRRRP